MRLVEGLCYWVLSGAGAALFGYAVASVGMRGRPTPQRIWGTLGALPRGRFAAYFGLLGFAWLTAVWLMWFLRSERYAVPVAGALAAIVALLVVGWVVAIVRNRETSAS